ncbi:MAG: nucleotidyltransferase domain-containing protein [Acidobacteriota bacterium]
MGIEQLLKDVRDKLSGEIRVTKVWLFGSRARGREKADSDYDIAVISNDFRGMAFADRQRLVRPVIREVIGIQPLDVACYTEDEYENGKTAFLAKIIEEEGIAVF